MTPHHHHHHSHHHANNLCNPYCCCSCSCNSPPPTSTDQQQQQQQLLQFISANLFKTQSFVNKPQHQHHQQQQQQTHSQSLLQDLIRRVSSLESSLSQLPPASSSPPPSPSLLRRRCTSPPPSLRELAARTIQARFRRFLVRRSQTLRDLKRLASIKSSAAALRSSISGGDADAEAMVLLLQLDSIQSEDPMIRDGKRSISRELVRMWRLAVRAMEEVEEAAPPVPRTRSGKRVSFEEEGKERFARVLEKEGVFGLAAPLPVQMEPRLGF